MDSSPLVKAHDHARAAAVATRQASDTTVAINEHTQAAGEFASAASATSSVEALRMLKLLEDHHRKLASLINLPSHQPPQQQQAGAGEVTDEKAQPEHDGTAAGDGKKETTDSTATKTAQKPGLPQQRRIASREMSSSIASNLASARGIRSKHQGQPLTPSVSNDQAPGNLDAHPRRDGSRTKMQNIIDHQSGKPTWVPPTPTSPSNKGETRGKRRPATVPPPTPEMNEAATDDGGYTGFYNTFGSLINRISAPLAFAGLPLIQEESTVSEELTSPEPSPSKRKQTPSSKAQNDPDLSKIYSKATMRAISNDAYGPSESFYVVPTSGHTISYANILSYAEKEKRRLGASSHSTVKDGSVEEDEDFVDAQETPVPLSPEAQRRVGRARTERELSNTIEELYTENRSLKDMLDKLTNRLHTFEASAQNMAESYRLMRPGSPLSTGAGGGGGGGGGSAAGSKSRDRSAERDEEFTAMKQHIEKLEKDNKKMLKTLEKYREKWESLKAGAKARREAQGGSESVEDAPAS